MALLKRIKASTLMETLVATVLIVVIFMTASMLLNNMLSAKVKRNTEVIAERMNALEYQLQNHALALPYYEEFGPWEINIASDNSDNTAIIVLEAQNKHTNNTVLNYWSYAN